jgi:hypothetical protein
VELAVAALLYLELGSAAVKVVAVAMAMALETQGVLGGTTHADWL